MSSICSQALSIHSQSFQTFLITFRNYIIKRQGTFGQYSQTNFCFTMYEPEANQSKTNFIGQMNINMDDVVLLVGVRIQQNQKFIRTLGLNKLKQRIVIANSAKGDNFICYFDEPTKTIIMRSLLKIPYILQQPNNFLSLLQSKIRKLLHLIGPNFNNNSVSPPNATMASSAASSTPQSSFMKNILSIIEMMEYERKNRVGCSQNLDFINRKYNNRGSEKIPRELMQKYAKTRLAYEDRLKKIFKGSQSKNEPKNESKVEPRILRWIQQISLELDNSWKNDQGMHGMVEKYNIVYKISEDESINAESNQEMAKFRQRNKKKQEMGSSPMFFEQTPQKQEEVIISSILVKKRPINEQSKSFDIEKKLLAYLRGERCYAINCYYSVEMQSIENMNYFYSDYHHKKITDFNTTKLKNYFRVFTPLCEGLLFLRWSGVSHRDLKPDNILLSKNNIPKIIDFGSGCHNRFFHTSANQHAFLKVINNELQTNQRYNLRYSALPKKVSDDLTRQQYEQHPHFDMFAFGSLMDELLGGDEAKLQMGDLESQYCKYIVDSCKQPNPIDRPDPKDLYTLIVQILKNKN